MIITRNNFVSHVKLDLGLKPLISEKARTYCFVNMRPCLCKQNLLSTSKGKVVAV